MNKTLVYNKSKEICKWVGTQLKEEHFSDWDHGLGVYENDTIIAGVVYNLYTYTAICMHVAAVPGKHWATRWVLFKAFAYPFLQLKCNRVTGLVAESNKRSQDFARRLGFVKEGVIRGACQDGSNMILYGMLKSECRFLRLAGNL